MNAEKIIKILVEVEKHYDGISCEIFCDEYYSECYDFDNLKDFKNNILKKVHSVTGNEKLTQNNLKIKYLNK
jgi:hypothetical protein